MATTLHPSLNMMNMDRLDPVGGLINIDPRVRITHMCLITFMLKFYNYFID